MQSECHPDREIYRKQLCKACYFRDYRKKGNNARSRLMTFLASPEGNLLLQTEIQKANEKYRIHYNQLKKLGKLQPLDEGSGERAREIWAELGEIYAKVEEQLPTPSDEKD